MNPASCISIAGHRGHVASAIHRNGGALQVSADTIRHLHRLTRGDIWDAGFYKEKESDIIERYPDGRSRVRFKTVPAAETPAAMRELLEAWASSILEGWTQPLVALAAFNLDFLCIHPFRDGNGRVSRLLLLLQCYHLLPALHPPVGLPGASPHISQYFVARVRRLCKIKVLSQASVTSQ